MPEMCKLGGGLYLYWRQISQLLATSGLTQEAAAQSPAYIEAFEQYKRHRCTCPYCLDKIQESMTWGWTAPVVIGNIDEVEA